MSSSLPYFETLGADWTRLQRQFFSDEVREKALDVAGVEAGQVAADLGAGTGFLTEGLLARGLCVVAVDQSPAMLDALRGRFGNAAALEGREGLAEALPIADGTVDCCFANMFLHHVADPPAVLREMARILRPGGRAVITDLDAHDFAFLREEHHDRWLGFPRDDLRAWFRAAGFSNVHVDGLGEACRATSTRAEEAAVGIFVASGTRGGGFHVAPGARDRVSGLRPEED